MSKRISLKGTEDLFLTSVYFRYQINTAKGILDTILNVQPKESGSGGGETRENIVYKLAEDMLEKLPPRYNSFEVGSRDTRVHILHMLTLSGAMIFLHF